MDDRVQLERAAARVTYLRGLMAVPFGLLMLATAAGNLEWGPYKSGAVYVLTVAVLAGAWWLIHRWYEDHYGRVRLTRNEQARLTAASLFFFGASLTLGSFLDSKLDWPICISAVLFGLAMLGWFAVCVGLRPDHLLVWGGLVVVGLLPVWGGVDDLAAVAWIPMGIAAIVAGVLDHRALVQRFGPVRGVHAGA
jgi:hypothetical protein